MQPIILPPLIALGSWADEMDAVPTGREFIRFYSQPTHHSHNNCSRLTASGLTEERSRLSDAPNRRDRDDFRCERLAIIFGSSYVKPRRVTADRPPREDLPLPTAPPYTAFVGNLAFDVTESEMSDFFGSSPV
jgi:hypothetical protein